MNNKRHTLEEHVEMGQLIKDACNTLYAIVKFGKEHDMIKPKDNERLMRQYSFSPAIEKLRCRLDDELFADCPWLTNDAFSVYYDNEKRVTVEELEMIAKRNDEMRQVMRACEERGRM